MESNKTIAIFGSTGSIGTQTLEVVREFPDQFKVISLSAFSQKYLLSKQAEEFSAKHYLGELSGKSIDEIVQKSDLIVNAIPGFAGLKISVAALKAGKTLLSANKESLAIAGKYLRELAEKHGGEIRPLDSEASAIWQLMFDYGKDNVKSVTLTCSGGPFYGKTTKDLESVTAEEALKHPTWKMGPKVSLDSATLINKLLEVYEVHNLFDIPLANIHITIHRQSVVHSMIHTHSGATKMHITQNDMRLPISYALNYPVQPKCPWPIVRTKKSELSFDAPDPETFRSLKWLELHKGNPNFPIILNATNDLATELFLKGEIEFLEIYDLIEAAIEKYIYEVPPTNLEELIEFHERITNEHSNLASRRPVQAS